MPLDLERFARTRPCLYHLTASSNADLIRRSLRLHPAIKILTAARDTRAARVRRRDSLVVRVGKDAIQLRDQAPLHAGNVSFNDGWRLEDLVEHLNQHVFFWPGRRDGPIPYGVRHFQRYAAEDAVVLVLNTAEVFAANAAQGPRFCQYNSGSPRCSGGKGSPRGPNTFAPASQYHGNPSSVVEVTFNDTVDLAECTVTYSPIADFV